MILEVLKDSTYLYISLIGVFVLFGLMYGLIEIQNSKYIRWTFGMNGIIFTGIIGATVHELSHMIMCLIFGHKINEVKLFRPIEAKKDGILGYVSHSYNKNSIYQRIGCFFIGIAPMIFGTVAIMICLKILVPDIYQGLNTCFEYEYTIKYLFKEIFAIENLLSLRLWIFLFLMFSISTHMSLSTADLKNSSLGLIFIFIIIFLISLVSKLLNIDILYLQLSLLYKYNLFIFSFLMLGLVFSVITLIISFLIYSLKKSLAR